jgi:hypothetical protein
LRGTSNQHDFFVHDSSPMHDQKWNGKKNYLDKLDWYQIEELWENTKVQIPVASTFIEGIGLLKTTGEYGYRRRALIHQISECIRLDIWRQSTDDGIPQDLLDALPAISFYLRDSLMAGGLIDHEDNKCRSCFTIMWGEDTCQCRDNEPGHIIAPSRCLFCFLELGSDPYLKHSHYKMHKGKIQETFSISMLRDFDNNFKVISDHLGDNREARELLRSEFSTTAPEYEEEAMVKMVNEDLDWPEALRDLFWTCKYKFTPLPG